MTEMWSGIEWRFKRAVYNKRCGAVLRAPTIRTRKDGVALFSMIGHDVVIPYIVAAKSLHHRLARGRFVIMDDGSLTAGDKALLAEQLDNPRILSIHDVDVGPCPHGGTWERLLTILDMAADDYVIQFDSDTVTTGPIPEVLRAVEENRCFTMLGADSPIGSAIEVGEFARQSFPDGIPDDGGRNGHIQGATEAILTRLTIKGRDELRYVRGCSGFAGFARGQNRGLATAFSEAVSAILGPKRWSEWGTEQVTSNFVVANSDGAIILPPDFYVNYWGEPVTTPASFLHFIGTYRWHKFEYQRYSMQAIGALTE